MSQSHNVFKHCDPVTCDPVTFFMIVPMKKIHVIVQSREMVPALEALRDLGVVHVERFRLPEGGMIPHYREDIRRIEEAVNVLTAAYSGKAADKSPGRMKTGRMSELKQAVGEILLLKSEIESLEEDLCRRRALIEQWQSWGDFNPSDFQRLESSGVHMALAMIADLKKAVFPPDVVVQSVGVKDSKKYLLMARDNVEYPFPTLELPAESLKDMKRKQKFEAEALKNLQTKLQNHLVLRESLEKILCDLRSKLAFEEVVHSAQTEDGISILKGFCPEEYMEDVTLQARECRWGFSAEDPSGEDQPPTLLKNPKWIRLIKPVFDLMNITPGYRELDVSPFFLIFLSIFFGMLIGDAGYGLAFIAVTFWAQKKFGDKVQDHCVFHLIYLLSSFAVIWGFLTGTFFGTVLFGQWIKPLLPWLTDNSHIQWLCFVIGGIHLTFAHGWRAINKWRTVGVLAEIGWIIIIWASVLFARLLIIGIALPAYTQMMLIAGPVLVVGFNQPRKNILAGIGLGLSDFLLSVMNFFGDIVSYIRLFAVGLAGVAVADSFNQMAMSVGFASPGAAIGALLILGSGHLLNMVLSLFAILVHGIRLNVLEFSSHLGMEWTGMPYNPLRK